MHIDVEAKLERALISWRKEADFVEHGVLPFLHRGLYEDYMAAIAALAAVLSRYTTISSLVESWDEHTLRHAVKRMCILAPGRGVLSADVLEGAAYWRRFRQLIAEHTAD